MNCVDCETFLQFIDNESIDAIITDPPYGIGHKYIENESTNTATKYKNWYLPIHHELMRILKPGGFWAIWQTTLYMRYFWEWFGNDIHIYIAAKNFVQLRKTPINYSYDPIVMGYKKGDTLLKPKKPKRNVDYFVSNTAKLVSNPKRIERQHPTPKPIDVIVQIIENFTAENALVFDPFFGSGSVAVACLITKRNFLGCEKEPQYCDLARQRISEYDSNFSY